MFTRTLPTLALLTLAACAPTPLAPGDRSDTQAARLFPGTCTFYDLDGDDLLDFEDFLLIADNWGGTVDGRTMNATFFLGFAAHYDEECGGGFCSAIAVSSLTLDIVDAAGDPLPGATATYSVDGGPVTACTGGADTLTCGFEQVGDFHVEVTSPAGVVQTLDTFVTLTFDECHPVGQRMTVAF